ncbi:AAA family ATPase [Nocardia puris]|uniref:AAA ATPase-like protein n=3 Tax=Nocardia puris TaxID=208602 RepID=A0A366E574_9NOCA|nr:LuxR family transcriptional regulator [Nocardia puris]MBF6215460.1 AAA family ATPase [Nocardia puris]MBF6369100.1 AAA family ATPase [Nocardia puris]MBF6463301.1 AAA family ATPase [Nocardia puris]RBO96664.1 AAA ATPase-like protein [Nocardia puris]
MVERSFVGRRAELSALGVAAESPGQPWVALVEGPAGIGKSRLLGAFAPAAARHGGRVIAVTATEDERPQPLHVAYDIVERLADTGADTAGIPDDADATRLGRALRKLLTDTVLIVDDAHWLDTESVRLLTFLVRNRPAALRLVLAYRTGQCPPALTRALSATGTSVRTVTVPPFTEPEVADLLPEATPARRAKLLAASGGNPLYLLLLADLPDREPADDDAYAGLDRTVRAELAQLPQPQRLVVTAAAVCGPDTDLEMLCATAESTMPEVTAALDALCARGLMTVDGGTISFSHPLVRTAAHRLAGAGWRTAAHHRVAAVLRARGAAAPALARHLELGMLGADEDAAAHLRLAAEQTLATAPATSVRWLDAARRADPARGNHPGDTLLLGRALLLSGAGERAREVLEPLVTSTGPHRLEALLLSARCERMLGRVDRARALLATAADLPLLPGDGPVQLELAILEMQDHQDAEGRARLGALFTSEAVADPAVRAAATALGCLGTVSELRIEAARTAFAAADRAFRDLDDDQLREVVHAVPALGWSGFFLDAHARVLPHLDRAVRVSARFGRSYALAELHTVRAYVLHKFGRPADALAAADDAQDFAERFGYPDLLPLAGALKIRVRQWTSPDDEVRRQWSEVAGLPRPVMRWWRQVVEWTLSDVGVGLGVVDPPDLPAALDDRPGPMQPTQLSRYANILLAQDDTERAHEQLRRAEAVADDLGLASQRAAATLVRAEYLCATGDPESGERVARAAAAEFEAADMPVQRGLAILLAADIAGRRGEFTRATEHLVAARDLFTAAGATRLITAATSAQRRLAGSRAPGAATELTPREREVAELAARGHANKEIATLLFLSPRTVEDHLSRILRKLGLTGRAGIAHRLAELDSAT